MAIQYEFRGISKRAKVLLGGSETIDVEFKESISGIKNGTLVAFANASAGGTVLIGVREVTLENGEQRGVIVGSDVSDKAKLQILNRAQSCIPPVQLEVFIENLDDTPFMRIEIPSGKNKPYCTGGGRYKIRGNARTNVLLPNQLLQMFMENESRKFFKRFGRATSALQTDLETIESKIDTLTQKLAIVEAEHNAELSLDGRLASLEAKIDALLAK